MLIPNFKAYTELVRDQTRKYINKIDKEGANPEKIKEIMEKGTDLFGRDGEVNIVLPFGSGGTCLGLHVAADILGLSWNIYGMCIGDEHCFFIA